jgi:hypothetical protein
MPSSPSTDEGGVAVRQRTRIAPIAHAHGGEPQKSIRPWSRGGHSSVTSERAPWHNGGPHSVYLGRAVDA